MLNMENCIHYGTQFMPKKEKEEIDPWFLTPPLYRRLNRRYRRRRFPFR